MSLTKSNRVFYRKLKLLANKNPSITLEKIGRGTGLTTGGVSWHMQVLKKAKLVKRDSKGRLIVK